MRAPTPLVRWTGGKVKLVPELMAVLPADWRERRYIDPFMGGGSLFSAMVPQRALVGDACLPLVALYATLKADQGHRVLAVCRREMAVRDNLLREHESPGLALLGPAAFATAGGRPMNTPETSKEERYKLWWRRITASVNAEEAKAREALQDEAQALAAQTTPDPTAQGALLNLAHRGQLTTLAAGFWMASESCFNGLWRVNQAGQFNVAPDPARMSAGFVDKGHFGVWTQLLQSEHVAVRWGSFEALLTQAGDGDLVFADSPYTDVVTQDGTRPSYVGWTADGWSSERTTTLWRLLTAAAERGAAVIHTNHDSREIRAWAARDGFTVQAIDVRRSISCDASTRGNIGEVICYRYPAGVERSSPQPEQFSLFGAAK